MQNPDSFPDIYRLWINLPMVLDVHFSGRPPEIRDSSPVERPTGSGITALEAELERKIWRSEMKLSTEFTGEIYEPKQTEANRTQPGQIGGRVSTALPSQIPWSASSGSSCRGSRHLLVAHTTNCAPLMGFKKRWIPQNKWWMVWTNH